MTFPRRDNQDSSMPPSSGGQDPVEPPQLGLRRRRPGVPAEDLGGDQVVSDVDKWSRMITTAGFP
jgi:hypothetical protein